MRKQCLVCVREFTDVEGHCPTDGALLVPVNEDPLLDVILDEKYQLLELVGQGGYGRVYRARHLLMGTTVAVKVLLTDILKNPVGLARFETEARATHQLVHTNIVSVSNYGVVPHPYIVMEFVEGKTLDQVIEKNGPLELEQFFSIFDQVCQAMTLAHQHKLLHRDLKPSNIMIDAITAIPKVLDFGVVKVVGEDHTVTGETVGSPPYMSPEQCMGADLDEKADVYSLGCVMYEALTGVKAFTGDNAVECMYKHFNVPPPVVSSVRQGAIPQGLDYLISKCLADHRDRYKTMNELRTDLLKVAAGTMKSRLPRVRRVTYRKTIGAMAEVSIIGSWAIVVAVVLVLLALYI